MINASSKVTMNFGRIRELTEASVTALEQTAEALLGEVKQAQVMPFRMGILQGEGTFVDASDAQNGTVSLISSTPYARRLYYHPEYNFRKDENPNARGNWYADWLKGGSKTDFAPKTYKELYRRNGGV